MSEKDAANVNTEEKSDDKKDIAMEEREKMLNVENMASNESQNEEKKVSDIKEGMEVKPKKIPIGGIQMPGFFTRSKSKERCKDDVETGASELIENKDGQTSTTTSTKIKLPNPFRKSKLVNEDPEKGSGEVKEKKKLLDTIRLPLVAVFPRKKTTMEQSLAGQAGLASVETLDDKGPVDKSQTELKNVALDDKAKDPEKVEEEETTWRQLVVKFRIAISATLIFILFLILISCITFAGSTPLTSSPVKDGKFIEAVTSCGPVEGLLEDSSFTFRGIPYALPPTGERRFKFANPLNRLEYCWNGTFLAHNSTEPCMQILSNGTVIGVEDCLTLDVVTPYVRYDNPLPVIVLIGADSLTGGSPGRMRPSARYARSRDVVFVRPNFRIGALGFLTLDVLTQESPKRSSGNYGLSDILTALEWIQRNIEHFGGDPKSVTLFGHRAGATLVTALATVPNAKKYFTRAWATSGGALFPTKERVENEKENQSFMEAVQCTNVTCLRALSAEVLVNAVEDTWRKPQPDLPSIEEDPTRRHDWLVIDGVILREKPATVWAREEDLPVNLVIGTTAHVASSEKLLLKHKNWTESLIKQHVNESVLASLNLTQTIWEMYPPTYKGLTAMISDIRTICPLFAITTQMYRVPFYVVTETRGKENLADIDSDIEAILGRYEPKTPEQRRYFSAMQSLFYHYVWHGNVNHTANRQVLIVGQDVLPNATYSHCAYWIQKNIVLKYAAMD